MPAVMRGGSAGKTSRSGGRGTRKGPATYAPAKLRSAAGVGLKPQAAVAAAGAVLGAGLILMLATGGRAQALAAAVGHGIDHRLGAIGFRVAAVQVKGASRFAEPDIRRALQIEPDASILGLNLPVLLGRVESVGWVRSATIARQLPDTLVVTVSERQRLAVWQSGGTASVVDPEGHVIPEADPGRFSDLPLVVGQGAGEAAASILPLIQTRPRLASRMEALVRVDGRRWDVRLKDGGLIQLPATGEDAALIQLDQLDQKSRLLELGFARIDLRDPQMVAVRPRTHEAEAGV
ncbi:MAG TPA: cell division protein FtsQ/DivIB [Caulobacteraceae bacterium]|jgi:cell division protein FtsQ|nr:cell division protein FtsQ/DivIB [Caulobacteraceae bacterium]